MSERIRHIKRRLADEIMLGPTFRRVGSFLGYSVAENFVDQIFELLGIEEAVAEARVLEGKPMAEFIEPYIKEQVGHEFAKTAPILLTTLPQNSDDRANMRQRITASAIIITKEP